MLKWELSVKTGYIKKCLIIKLSIFFNLLTISPSSDGAIKCEGQSFLAVNGDNGYGDNCDFYIDLYRTRKSVKNFNQCRSYITPKKSKFEEKYSCRGIANAQYKKGVRPSKATLKDKLFEMVKNNPDQAHFIMFTDHGTKVYKSDGSVGETQISMGDEDVTETELKHLIFEMRKEQKKASCEKAIKEGRQCTFTPPPLLFTFDHCYSGGMLNSLEEEGVPGENLCGVASSQPDELSFTGDSFMKSVNTLRYGFKKNNKYRKYYLKYDLNGDGEISFFEASNYHNKKAQSSLPLRSSEKYLLDFLKKSKLNTPIMIKTDLSKEKLLCFKEHYKENPELSNIVDLGKKGLITLEVQELNSRIKRASKSFKTKNSEEELKKTLELAKEANIIELAYEKDLAVFGKDLKVKMNNLYEKLDELERQQYKGLLELKDIEISSCLPLKGKKPIVSGCEEDAQKVNELKEKIKDLHKKIDTEDLSDKEWKKLDSKMAKLTVQKNKLLNGPNGILNKSKEILSKQNSCEACKEYQAKSKKLASITKKIKQEETKLLSETPGKMYKEFSKLKGDKFKHLKLPKDFIDEYIPSVDSIKESIESYRFDELVDGFTANMEAKVKIDYARTKEKVQELRRLNKDIQKSIALNKMLKSKDKKALTNYTKLLECENVSLFRYKR